jgi:predicted DNA-binding transcriptional regulator AlpA
MNNETPPRRLLPYDEVRHLLGGISRTTLHELMNAGRVERVKLGTRGFVTMESIDRFIAELKDET